jgi:hypothetical protein
VNNAVFVGIAKDDRFVKPEHLSWQCKCGALNVYAVRVDQAA